MSSVTLTVDPMTFKTQSVRSPITSDLKVMETDHRGLKNKIGPQWSLLTELIRTAMWTGAVQTRSPFKSQIIFACDE